MPKQKRPYTVEIEAKLTVHAFDEDSARTKVEKAFASGRMLGVGVDAATECGRTSSYRSRARRELDFERTKGGSSAQARPRRVAAPTSGRRSAYLRQAGRNITYAQ